MKTLAKFKFCLTRLVLLLLCLWALAPQATADVTIWVQADSAPHLFLKNGSGTCTGTASGTAYSAYTSSPGVTMTNNVTTSDGKKWYYEVFKGLSSTTIAFNNGSTGNSNQTTDITSVSGNKYYYYGGNGYHIDLTSLKGTLATNYCFFQNNSGFTTRYVYTFNSETEGGWPGKSFSTKVGYNRDGSYDIYYVPLTGTTTPGKIIFHNNSGNQSANLDFSKGNLYWYGQNNGGSFASITVGAWPEMPAVSTHSFTVNVYDATGAPKVNGTTLSNTTSGTNCQWYTYTYEDTTLPSSVTIASNAGPSATLSNPADGQTYYYAYNGYTMQAVNSDYDPNRRNLVYWPNGKQYANATNLSMSTTDGINFTATNVQLYGNDWFVFTTSYSGDWNNDKPSFYAADSNVTISGTQANGTTAKGKTGIYNVTNSGLWTITYNIINNAWTATRTGDLPQNTYNIHVIEYKGGTPYLYVFNAGSANSANFPGSKMTETEVSAAGETWYKTTLSTTASTISVIASLGGSSSQTADITGIAPGDYYIVFDGSTKTIKYQGTTMPEGKVQAEKNAFTVYVKADDAPHIYVWDDNDVAIGTAWPGVLMSDAEQLADGTNWWKFVVETYDNDINLLFHNNGGGSGNQSADIKQTEAVGYYVYDGNQKAVQTVEPTGKMYVIGQVGGNPWSATMGKEMTAASDGTTFTLNNVQIIAGSTFAFASRMADESLEGDAAWAMLNSYRLTSNPGNGGTFWGVTNAMTDKDNPQALDLRIWNGADKNFKMDETAYYDITVDMKAMTVTIKRRYGALYMFYGDSNSPYWKPNAGVPMFTTDGKTFMLTNVELDVDDTFQFATQLGEDENTWPANTYRYGANSAGNNNWLVTESQIDVVLENALRAETGKDFQMGSGTAGTYRVMVNPEAKTVALYRMADVTGSKVIIHLEKTSNVTNPKIWAYDKERDLADTAYIHVDRPSRIEIATNRHALREGQDPDTIVTVGGRQWWTWEVGKAIADFWFTRNGYDYESVQTTEFENKDMTDIQWRRSGEIYLTWPTTGTTMEDHTRDYYAAAAQEAPECAVMIEGHEYAYFTNTPGWAHVFCHAWYTDNNGENHDILTPPAPYEGDPCYPGALCELVGYDKDGYEVWRIDLTAAGVTTYPNGGILFNNGIDDNHVYEHDMNHDYYTGTGTLAAKEQSSDFAYSTGACYDYCGLIVLGRSLSNIIRNGVVDGPIYTIEDDIVGVWVDPNEVTEIEVDGVTRYVYGALYCKDLNNFVTTPYVEKSIQKDGEIDYVLQLTNLMNGKNRYDQSNWVKLTLSTLYPKISSMSAEAQVNLLRLYEGYVLPAESVHAQLVNNVNPEMRIAHALPEPIEENKYRENPNVFTTANFVGTQDCEEPVADSGHTERNTYFFVTPKPQEYAKITWAVYAGNDKFYVPDYGSYALVDGHYEFMNQGNLDGYFPVKWDLMQQVPNITKGEAYWFYAIIRLADENNPAIAGDGPTRTNGEVPYKPYAGTVPYIVYPTNISASSIITAVNDVNTVKTVKQVRYYNLAGVESSEPFDGVNVVVTTYTDGTRTAVKVVK